MTHTHYGTGGNFLYKKNILNKDMRLSTSGINRRKSCKNLEAKNQGTRVYLGDKLQVVDSSPWDV